jgi:hypothetical protein
MRNITVSVTDDVYREARIWAAENNTSVSAAVRYFLENVRRILRVHRPPETARQAKRIGPPSPGKIPL